MTTPPSQNRRTGQELQLEVLRQQGRNQVLELFRVAEQSHSPEIRAEALKQVKAEGKHYRRQEAKISPTLAVAIVTIAIAAAGAFSVYAILEKPFHIALEVCGCSAVFLLFIIAVVALFTGNLSQENFMRLIDKGWSWIRSHWPGKSMPDHGSVNAAGDSDANPRS